MNDLDLLQKIFLVKPVESKKGVYTLRYLNFTFSFTSYDITYHLKDVSEANGFVMKTLPHCVVFKMNDLVILKFELSDFQLKAFR